MSRRTFSLLEQLKIQQVFRFLLPTTKKCLRKLFGRVFKKVLVLSTVAIWRKLVLWRFVFFLLSGKLKKSLCLLAKEADRNCQNFIYRIRGVFYEKCFSLNIWSFFDAPALWAECSEPFRGIKQEWLPRQNSTCPEHQFSCWKFEISTIVYISCTYSGKQFKKMFWQTCQKCTSMHHSKIVRKTSFLEFCFSPGILNKKIVPYGKRNSAKLSKLLFLSPEYHLSR